MPHFVHYVKRKVVQVNYNLPDDPWFTENQPEDQGFDAPTYHVTRSTTGPAKRVAIGDTLWIFSQLQTPWGTFPPALDAKLTVARVSREDPGFRFSAGGESSAWFPLFDATDAVLKITTIDSKEERRSLLAHRSQPVGRVLQSLRQITDAGPMLELEQQLAHLGFDFVSYRLVDGTKRAFEKSLQLVRGGKPVFWDRWSLPRRLAERREFVSHAALDRFIRRRIEESQKVWGIESPKYSEAGSYSSREKDAASAFGKFSLWSTGETA